MKIIAGKYKGKEIKCLKGNLIRPTLARVREMYFNVVRDYIEGANFLDICSGTGSMGIEALSRGARFVLFMEKEKEVIELIKLNLKRCDILYGYKILQGDFRKKMKNVENMGIKFDLIYFDPPYFKNLYRDFFDLIRDVKFLSGDIIIATNHFKKIELPDKIHSFIRFKKRRQGDSIISFYRIKKD